MNPDILVVGGGAAGMMAAIAAAEASGGRLNIVVVEKNEKLGKKLFITGKGRCNLTNSCETPEFFSHVISNPKFLYSSIYGFDHDRVADFFEKAGCPLKEERGGRLFPVSDHSSDVIRALERKLKEYHVQVQLNTRVLSITRQMQESDRSSDAPVNTDGELFSCTVLQNGKESFIKVRRVVLAGGGCSYPSTGADTSLLHIAGSLGHNVTELHPALVPFNIRESWCASLMGLALKNVGLQMHIGKKKIYDGFGELLFTHFGVSGPLILTASSHYSSYCRRHGTSEAVLTLDLKPALSPEQLDARILRDFDAGKNKAFSNILGGLLPGKMAEIFPDLLEISPQKKVHDITQEERRRLGNTLKALVIHVSGCRDFHEAIVTSGGISVKEIDPGTMGSRCCPGLYLAGEMLDVDAVTGGYNLQIAWSTGRMAGESAALSLLQ